MATINSNSDSVYIDMSESLELYDKKIINGRKEQFLYALCALDSEGLPVPLSRIELWLNGLVTGDVPTIEPQSRNEYFLKAILTGDTTNLPVPQSRVEILLNKLANGDTDLSDCEPIQSRYEFLLSYLIKNGGIGGDIEYITYKIIDAFETLYTTAEKPVKSAILTGSTKYRDIDTGEFLETFEEGRNLELVSVRMPVLSTTGKNMLCSENSIFNASSDRIYRKIYLKQNTDYYMSAENKHFFSYRVMLCKNDGDVNVNKTPTELISLNSNASRKFNSGNYSGEFFILFHASRLYADYANNWVQVEEGTQATPYEPYKTNILSCNEDVELRGIGDVKDELNLLTGELTQRIAEIVLDDNENWSVRANFSNGDCKAYSLTINDYTSNIVCDGLKILPDNIKYGIEEGIFVNNNLLIVKKNIATIELFKQWLSQNPLTVQYQLETESIKTVDLSIKDQDNQPTKLGTFENITHVSLESIGLIPEVDMEVATRISEELASTSQLMDDISVKQEQLETTVDEQSENVDATMIATTEIYEETL